MALENLRDKFWKPAAAMGLAATMAMTPAAAQQTGNAQADPNFPPLIGEEQSQSYEDVEVPIRDVREARERIVTMAAARSSGDAQVVVYFGDEQDVLNKVYSDLQKVVGEGELPFRGLVLADPREEIFIEKDLELVQADQELWIYTDGIPSTRILNPDVETDVAAILERDYKKFLEPKVLADASPRTVSYD